MKITTILFVVLLGLGSFGCHADPDDAPGQAKELADPVRRDNAINNITRLYTQSLERRSGDRTHADVKAIVDATQAELVKTYLDYPEDNQSRRKILDLLYEMRDPRTLPALVKALDWRQEVNEQQAITAAKTLAAIDIPAGKKPEVVNRLAENLSRVNGTRGVDNQMRIEFLRTLGGIGDRSATPILVKIATEQPEEQNFLINRLAAEQLAQLGDPETVPALIKGLFLFDSKNPAMRMNDVAAQGLVVVGRPALEPLLRVLRGEDADANALVDRYIASIRERDPAAAQAMSARTIISNEAAFALGQLGLRDAIDPLLEETRVPVSPDEAVEEQNTNRRIGAVIALVAIAREESDTPRIREAILAVYRSVEKMRRMQLLVAMQHLIDPGLLPFLLEEAKRPEDELPDIRILALRSYSFLANKAETAAAREVINAEPSNAEEGGFRQIFAENEPGLAAADECDADLACWINKLNQGTGKVARKAAYMIARYGRGNPQAISALVARMNTREEEVRGDVLYALDFAASQGSTEAVAKIDEMKRTEEGQAVWNHTKDLLLATQARLRSRGQH